MPKSIAEIEHDYAELLDEPPGTRSDQEFWDKRLELLSAACSWNRAREQRRLKATIKRLAATL